MKKRIASVVLVSALGVGAATTFVVAPALADQSATKRQSAISDALKGLVTDGTLTQAQADKVASTLDAKLPKPGGPGEGRGPGGMARGMELQAAADLLKMSIADLRTALKDKSLAQVAESKGISKTTLIDTLVNAATPKLDEAVKNGKLTQAQADKVKAEMKTRITEQVDRVGPPALKARDGRGPGGHGGFGRPGGAPNGEAPAATQSG